MDESQTTHDHGVGRVDPGSMAAVPAAAAPAHAHVLDSVAAFTHHRDIDALDHSLVLSLAELASASRVSLAKRVVGGSEVESIVQCVAGPDGRCRVQVIEPPLADPVLLARLDRRMEQVQIAVEQLPAGYRLSVPMLREGRAMAALEMDSGMPLGAVRPLAEGFARIYANYTALLHESERDKLTGLYNRRSLERQLQRLLQQKDQAQAGPSREVWLAILDIDHFKHINDSYGHIYGDEVILLLAQQMRACFRRGDVLFRFGGEEFVILFAAAAEATVKAVLERFRQKVAGYVFPQVGRVTVSIGYAHVGRSDYPANVLDRADKALYFAKNHGRNATWGYESLDAAGAIGQALAVGTIDLF
jgi:diguanylate cyclase (GGDEF)-like protein